MGNVVSSKERGNGDAEGKHRKREGTRRFLNIPLAHHEFVSLALGHRTTLARAAEGSDQADELRLFGRLGHDVVGLIVSIVAGKFLAARHWCVLVGREELFHAVEVLNGVDNGGHIEVCVAVPSLEGHLANHPSSNLRALGDGVEVADPGLWEGGSALRVAVDDEALHFGAPN